MIGRNALKMISKGALSISVPILKVLKVIGRQVDSTGTVFVLIFHDVPKHQEKQFRDLLVELKKQYGFIAPEDFVSFLNGDMKLNGDRLLITFDDGFMSNYDIAQEILGPLQIRAIFFVSTGFIEASSHGDWNVYIAKNLRVPYEEHMRPMTLGNLAELVSDGHTIGAHTKSHLCLSEIDSVDILREEIISSGDHLEEMLGVKVEHFAYPFGNVDSINKEAMEIAKSRYKHIYSGVRGANKCGMNPGAIRREAINFSDEIKYNLFVAGGGLSFYYLRDRNRLDSIVSDV